MHFDEEFEEIYHEHSDKIFRFIYLHTQDFYLSEDFTSEVFLKAWKNWEKFKPDFTKAWLYKIANNLLIDYWRNNKNKKKISLEIMVEEGIEPSYDEDLIEKIQKDETIKKINNALKELPKNLKDVAILRFIEGLSSKESGEILKLSEGNIRVLQHRALVKLKEILKNG
ncbi:RNA polymerase sigma factor [Candidatus Microgenomates bacterium]|nr:MAG: RNA polymerase sigma factor [Candidatus Microgenomates bacterium]